MNRKNKINSKYIIHKTVADNKKITLYKECKLANQIIATS